MWENALMDLFGQTDNVISKALDGVSKRHEAIASNVANAETPGYKKRNVSFEAALKQAITMENDPQSRKFLPEGSLKTTNAKHYNPNPVANNINDVAPVVQQDETSYRFDDNGVDVEEQMAQLAKNTMKYMALGRMASRRYNVLKTVIRGGS